MKGLKDFRRSLNKDKANARQSGAGGAAPSTFAGVKNAISIQPPKLVIRATREYRSRAPQELSFRKGDFFHVFSDAPHDSEWFEASNPSTNARGLVPSAYFEVLGKNTRTPGGQGGPPTGFTNPSGAVGAMGGSDGAARAAGASVSGKGGGGLYAVVKYDFAAERTDELEAKAGESIIVIAQSNFEWFVAKPIGRLGGPGLIPVAFVEIKDLTTGKVVENVQELIQSGVVPKVEEWKKMAADYKANTIPLGRFDFAQSAPVNNSPYAPQGGEGSGRQHLTPIGQMERGPSADQAPFNGGGGYADPNPTPPAKEEGMYGSGGMLDNAVHEGYGGEDTPNSAGLPPGMPPGEPLPVGLVTTATVDSFHFEQSDYWFRIQASHIAGAPGPDTPPEAPIAPEGEERDLILYRLYEDFYEFQIALMDHFQAEAGRLTDAAGNPTERILPLMPGPLQGVNDLITAQRRADLDQYIIELTSLPEYILRSELVRLFFEPRPGDHCTTHPPASPGAGMAGQQQRQQQQQQQQGLGSDSQTFGNWGGMSGGQDHAPNKYSDEGPLGPRANGGSADDELSGRIQSLGVRESSGDALDNQQRGSHQSSGAGSVSRVSGATGAGSSSYLHAGHPSLTAMSRNASANTLDSGDSRGSGGIPKLNGSGSSPAASTPPFIKIKIHNKSSDDLVAIRVPPSVTLPVLLEKVRERLGSDIRMIRYRDEVSGGTAMMRISDDEDLKEWLTSGGKMVLYADSK